MENITEMLNYCMEHIEGEPSNFIYSLSDFYDRHGYLTSSQQSALEKFYKNAKRSNREEY